MAIEQDVYTLLSGIVSVPVEQNTIDVQDGKSRVWYGRESVDNDLFLSRDYSWIDNVFNVEVISDNLSTNQSLAALIFALHGTNAKFGNTQPVRILVEDQRDDYTPFNQFADDKGLHVSALKISIRTT